MYNKLSDHTDEQMSELAKYYDVVRPYFQVCADSSVLEIGPFNGIVTNLYYDIADTIDLVEPNSQALPILQNSFPNATLVWDDIFTYLKAPQTFDVVVCLGVLYHLHSPIQLLEQLVNDVQPSYILLDTSSSEHLVESPAGNYFNLGIAVEEVNTPGNYYTKPGKTGQRTPGISLSSFGPNCVTQVMTAMGYEPLCKPIMSPIGFKQDLAFLSFKRIN